MFLSTSPSLGRHGTLGDPEQTGSSQLVSGRLKSCGTEATPMPMCSPQGPDRLPIPHTGLALAFRMSRTRGTPSPGAAQAQHGRGCVTAAAGALFGSWLESALLCPSKKRLVVPGRHIPWPHRSLPQEAGKDVVLWCSPEGPSAMPGHRASRHHRRCQGFLGWSLSSSLGRARSRGSRPGSEALCSCLQASWPLSSCGVRSMAFLWITLPWELRSMK